MTDKLYLDANRLLNDSFRLAHQVYRSGFEPTFIMALWRGGAPIGLAVQEYFAYREIETDHILIRTSSYHDIDSFIELLSCLTRDHLCSGHQIL